LMERKGGAAGKLREEADHWLPQVKGVPIIATSGMQGEGLDRLMQAASAGRDFLESSSRSSFLFEHDLSDLPSPAEAGFAQAGNRFPLFGIML